MRLRWTIVLSAGMVYLGLMSGTASAQTRLAQASTREQAKTKKAEGDQLYKAKKEAEAIRAYQEAARLDPSWYESYQALGNLHFAAKRYDAAIAAYAKAVEANPRYHTGLYNIAFAYRKARNFPRAVEYYKKYIERRSTDPDAYYGLAVTYESLGKKREAVAAYLKYAEMEKRPSERKYIIKARNKAEKLRKELGVERPATAAASQPAPATPSQPAATGASSVAPTSPSTAAPPSTTPSTSSVAAGQPKATASAANPETSAKTAASARSRPVAPRPSSTTLSETSNQVARWIAEGDKALQEGSYTRAMKRFFDAARADPRNTDAVYKLGLVYEKTGNTRAAELKWRTVLEIDPEHRRARRALAQLKAAEETKPAAVAARPTAEKAQPAPAPGAARKAGAPAPSAASAGKPAEASVERPTPTSPAATPSKASLAPRVAAVDRAPASVSADARKALELIAKGDAHFKQKAFSKAIVAYTHATQLSPTNERALFKLATAYAYAGNLKVAVFKWKQVLKLNPNNAAALRNIQRAEAKLKRTLGPSAAKPASSTPDAKPAAPQAGDDFELLLAQARAAKKKGQATAMLNAADKALRIKQDARAVILRGEALVILRRYAEAKKSFSRAMVLDPNLAAPFYGLGDACRLTGDDDRARYYFKLYVRSKAKDVQPPLVERAKAFLAKH